MVLDLLRTCFYIRWESNRDLQGDIESGISRSADAGKKWDPMHGVLARIGDGELPRHFNGVSDACLLVDAKGHTIFVFGCWMACSRDCNGNFRSDISTAK